MREREGNQGTTMPVLDENTPASLKWIYNVVSVSKWTTGLDFVAVKVISKAIFLSKYYSYCRE